jgi:hypothetical protein
LVPVHYYHWQVFLFRRLQVWFRLLALPVLLLELEPHQTFF